MDSTTEKLRKLQIELDKLKRATRKLAEAAEALGCVKIQGATKRLLPSAENRQLKKS